MLLNSWLDGVSPLFAASVVWLVYAVKVLLSLFRLIGTLREALVVKA